MLGKFHLFSGRRILEIILCLLLQSMGLQTYASDDKENIPPFYNIEGSLVRKRLKSDRMPLEEEPVSKRLKSQPLHGFNKKMAEQLEALKLNPARVWGFHQILYHGEPALIIAQRYGLSKEEGRVFFEETLKSRHFLRVEAISSHFLYTNALLASASQINRSFMNKCRETFADSLREAERKFFRQPPDNQMIAFKHQERQERQRLNWQSGVFTEERDAQTLALEQEKWQDFFAYFKTRNARQPLKRKEIEETFEKLVAPHYAYFYINKDDKEQGIFFYAPDTLSPNRLDNFTNPGPRTNIERVQDEGLSPIGADYAEMNIHHLTYHQPGVYVLLSRSFHRDFCQQLHFSVRENYKRPPAPDRRMFTHIKQDHIFPQLGELMEVESTSVLSHAASEG